MNTYWTLCLWNVLVLSRAVHIHSTVYNIKVFTNNRLPMQYALQYIPPLYPPLPTPPPSVKDNGPGTPRPVPCVRAQCSVPLSSYEYPPLSPDTTGQSTVYSAGSWTCVYIYSANFIISTFRSDTFCPILFIPILFVR